jgi:hypothetical protein
MNPEKPLQLVYESIYSKPVVNESFMGLGSLKINDVYGRLLKVLRDSYGDAFDMIVNDVKVDDVKRKLIDLVKNSDASDMFKTKIINKIGNASNLCSLHNLISINSPKYGSL